LLKGLVKRETDGALYVDITYPGAKESQKKYILRNNETAFYLTYDLGLAYDRYKKYKFDRTIYVTDFRQIDHFKSLFYILNIFGYEFANSLKHLPFGVIRFGNEILATREGKVVLLEDLITKTIEKAKEEIDKRKTNGDPKKVGVGAIKYLVLKYEPMNDVSFTWETALSFDGNTGPYLQYSYARASSIIRKAKNFNKSNDKTKNKIYHDLTKEEIKLIKRISDFPDIILQAEKNLNPAIIANYSFSLAQVFNEFYHACPVLNDENKSEEAFRLRLVDSFRVCLQNALHLLGIEVMEEM
jgi:arginyl-tRNA synthetase